VHKDLEIVLKKIVNIAAIILLPIVFIVGSLHITTDFTDSRHVGPDEEMRYFMPEFILENHRLPTGYETETWGNWSYGFYPQFLGAIVSTGFMAVVSIFSNDTDSLIRAARLASVVFGTIAAIFVRNTARLIFNKHKHRDAISNLAMLLFALWPQVAFLSSYTNNDIVGLAGVSIILYACVHAYRNGVKYSNALYYAVGATIAMLGYLNSYGFVLIGFVFLLTLLLKSKMADKAFILKYLLISLGITGLLVLPFLIRNAILYDGDIFGLNTFRSEYLRWLAEGGFPMQSPYASGIYSLFVDTRWLIDTVNSFIFGYFASWGRGVGSVQYWPYYLIVAVTSVAAVFAYKNSRNNITKKMLIAFVAIGCAITVVISLYYTLKIDYQPQGRYVIYLMIPLVIGMIYGVNYLIEKIIQPKYRVLVIYCLCAIYGLLYFSVAYPTLLA